MIVVWSFYFKTEKKNEKLFVVSRLRDPTDYANSNNFVFICF